MLMLLFSTLLILTPVDAPAQRQSAELQTKLGARVSEFSLSANGLADAIAKTGKHFELPVGIEWVRDKEALRPFNRTWKGETVQAIMLAIVKDYAGYALRVEHGAIHVFRSDLVNDPQNFLNLKVPGSFDARREIGGLTNQRLRRVVQSMVSQRKLPAGAGEAGSYGTGLDEKPVTVALRGLTVREALQKLTEASEQKIWVATFTEGLVLTPKGFRQTETLWNSTPLPDTEQPVWDFIAWEQYRPESMPRNLQ